MSEDEKRLRQMLLDAVAAEKGGVDVAQLSQKMDDVDGQDSTVTPSDTEISLPASEFESEFDTTLVETPEPEAKFSLAEEPSEVAVQEENSEESPVDTSSLFDDPTITTAVASSALALLIVSCIGAALYSISCARGLLRSDAAWGLMKDPEGRIALPGTDGDEDDEGNYGGVVEKVVLNEKDVEKGRVVILRPEPEVVSEKNDVDIDSASSVGDDADYMDALDSTPSLNHPVLPPSNMSPTASPLPRWSELARKDTHAELRRQHSLSNLNLNLKTTTTPPSSLSRGTSKALLRELAAAAAAADTDPELPAISPAPAPAPLTSTATPTPKTPVLTSTPPRHQVDLHAARRNASQGQNPEERERHVLDFALAMQLGPSSINGTGMLGALARVGADPAWVLNVVLAVFGWVAVIIGGQGTRNTRERERRSMIAR